MIRAWLIAGLGFLYLPLAVLVIGSFNAQRLSTSWGGVSTRWYAQVLADPVMIDAALLSLRVAVVSACASAVLGFLAGHALARRRVPGAIAFSGLLAAPLVLPDLLIGFCFVLLFVVLGVPRGAATITLAHATIGMSYVAVVVRAHLAASGTVLEDAARDLGATEASALLRITLPLAAPALLAGWLLAFTLSLDDLVVASFVSGPGATTLPMVIFSALRLGATPALAALATLLLGCIVLALGLAALLPALLRRHSRV
jgi:putrescine transport system permease protein